MLRPLTTLEVLDAGLHVLQRNWLRLYAYSSIGTLPVAALLLYYFYWLSTLVENAEGPSFTAGTVYWSAAMALAWTLHSVFRSAGTIVALADMRNETPLPATLWSTVRKHAAGAAFVGLSSFALAWLAGTCLFGPGLFLAAGWWIARPALLVEERPFVAALRRSWRLTDGHRGKSFGLWLALALVAILGAANLFTLVKFLMENVAGLFGIDTSGIQPNFQLGNRIYLIFLAVLLFVLLDPLKTAIDAVLYLDLRIRREGADLQEQLRTLRLSRDGRNGHGPAGAVAAFLLAALLIAGPARAERGETLKPPDRAVPVTSYLEQVEALKRQVAGAEGPKQVDPKAVSALRGQTVNLIGGQRITVANKWLDGALGDWKKPEDRDALVHRLDALERSLAGVTGRGSGELPTAAEADPKQALGQILQEPEFQKLAARAELQELVKNVKVNVSTKTWWDSFLDWLKGILFKPPQIKAPNPQVRAPALGWLQPVFWVLLAVSVLFVLAMIVKSIIERPIRGAEASAGELMVVPPLEASATENALDHTVDEWERFAQQWLGRGDVRQAVRALYLATLVHLHRERHIDYNRAFTNWVYVRHFRGEREHQEILRGITRIFDEVWYGERPCGETQYRYVESGARALGTPAPGVSHG
jgi:hypothetical protein